MFSGFFLIRREAKVVGYNILGIKIFVAKTFA